MNTYKILTAVQLVFVYYFVLVCPNSTFCARYSQRKSLGYRECALLVKLDHLPLPFLVVIYIAELPILAEVFFLCQLLGLLFVSSIVTEDIDPPAKSNKDNNEVFIAAFKSSSRQGVYCQL